MPNFYLNRFGGFDSVGGSLHAHFAYGDYARVFDFRCSATVHQRLLETMLIWAATSVTRTSGQFATTPNNPIFD